MRTTVVAVGMVMGTTTSGMLRDRTFRTVIFRPPENAAFGTQIAQRAISLPPETAMPWVSEYLREPG